MFIDKAKIYVKGGDGGNGIVAFRREKHVPLGGPAGGDGGRGGNVVIIADEGLRTLMDFKYQKHFKASRGSHGLGKNMHGASGEDIVIRVPQGTVIRDADTGELLADMTVNGQEIIIARGGRGGRGNSRFASARNKAPSLSENGEPGEAKWISLELKLLADVGLVGFPNAGKSTLISRVSAANPKIADYPFTTLYPNLGVVMTKNRESFVIADIPGLIEGAHKGAGLGIDFLRHIERTKVLLIVLDTAETEGRDVLTDCSILLGELAKHDANLLNKPLLIVANKMDLPEAKVNVEKLQKKFADKIYCISAATGEGVGGLIEKTNDLIKSVPDLPVSKEAVTRKYEIEKPFVIDIVDGIYQVSGKRIERLFAMTNFTTDEGLQRFQRTIIKMGLEDALRQKGIKAGDTVRIKDVEFEYSE